MWQIVITDTASEDLIHYFRLYRDYFIDMFTDTGLWNEDDICLGYELLAFGLITDLRRGIEEKLMSDTVIGWKQAENDRQLLMMVSKRYIRISYSEDAYQKVRTVNRLEIWRKK